MAGTQETTWQPKEAHIRVLKVVAKLGGKMVSHVDVVAQVEKRYPDIKEPRNLLKKLWQEKYLSWQKEDDEKPRSADLFTLLASGRKLIG